MLHLTPALAMASAVALSAALVGAPTASAARAAAEGANLTDYGMRSDVYGVKLVTENVELKTVKDAHAQLVCTRQVGKSKSVESLISVPDNPLVALSLSTSTTDTYREGDRVGVRGVNKLGDVRIGGTLGDLKTPTLVIEGLTTTADAFRTPQGFGHTETFDFAGIRLELLEGTSFEGTPLAQLLEPLNQVTDTVFEGTNEVANEVFHVLQSATAPIQIPGLGSIALGKMRGRTTSKSATSEAMALEIEITAGGSRQLVELGSANARIGGPAKVGVFRAGGTALDMHVLSDLLNFGGIQHKSLPCEGTLGKTVKYHVPRAQQVLGVITDVQGVTYSHRGIQKKGKKRAAGFSAVDIEKTTLPLFGLEIRDIHAKISMRNVRGKARVKAATETSIGSITMRGEKVDVPAPGQVVDLPGGAGQVERQIIDRSFYGDDVIALRVTLFNEAVVIDLGIANGHIYPR